MDKDRIKGKMNDVKGRVERQAGEWAGDKDAQAKGAMDQAKGKAQNAFGKMKDAGRDAIRDLEGKKNRPEDREDGRDVDEDAA